MGNKSVLIRGLCFTLKNFKTKANARDSSQREDGNAQRSWSVPADCGDR